MNKVYWDTKLDFLRAIRSGWCNNDYIEFLIEKVWMIDKPVKVIDYGCGFGYIGLLLLPLLPKGSSYTGLDISDVLLEDARRIFEEEGLDGTFIETDLLEYEPEESFDIAVSQAVLRHIPDANRILNKMIRSVAVGGMVICMEADLEIEKTVQFISGFDYIATDMPSLYRKMYRKEYEAGGRDYRVGIKIPIMMQEFGLNGVDVRLNDRVKFINPNGDKQKHDREYAEITAAWDWNKKVDSEKKDSMMEGLSRRGLTESESSKFVEGHTRLVEHIINKKDDIYILKPSCTLILLLLS